MKLFDGSLVDVTEPTQYSVCEVLNSAYSEKNSIIHPSQVVLVTEDIAPHDREEGIGAYVLITPRVKVCLHTPYAQHPESCAASSHDDWFEWLADCVNETVLDWFLPRIDNPQFVHLFRNTHPKVVSAILENERLLCSLGASSNGADEVLDRLMKRPDLLSIPYLLTNKNVRAVLYGLTALDVTIGNANPRESWHMIMFVTRLPYIFRAHHDNADVMHQVERLLLRELDEWPSILRTFLYPEVVEMCERHSNRFGNHEVHPDVHPEVQDIDMPSSLSNSDDRVVKDVVGWMETHRLAMKELMKQDYHVLWQYQAYAMRNTNRDMVMYLLRVWPELCDDKVILERVSAWPDVDVQWADV